MLAKWVTAAPIENFRLDNTHHINKGTEETVVIQFPDDRSWGRILPVFLSIIRNEQQIHGSGVCGLGISTRTYHTIVLISIEMNVSLLISPWSCGRTRVDNLSCFRHIGWIAMLVERFFYLEYQVGILSTSLKASVLKSNGKVFVNFLVGQFIIALNNKIISVVVKEINIWVWIHVDRSRFCVRSNLFHSCQISLVGFEYNCFFLIHTFVLLNIVNHKMLLLWHNLIKGFYRHWFGGLTIYGSNQCHDGRKFARLNLGEKSIPVVRYRKVLMSPLLESLNFYWVLSHTIHKWEHCVK